MSPIDNKLLVPRQEPLLLDYAPGAAAAYSLRKLSLSYTGPVVTVRRSSDDAEAEFTAAEIDDGTLLGWVGAGVSAYVKTWHDQSGEGNDATQTTAGYQPRIVDAGTLETEGGKAAVRFDGSDDWLGMSPITNTSAWSAFAVTRRNAAGEKGISLANELSANVPYPFYEYSDNVTYIRNAVGYRSYNFAAATQTLFSAMNPDNTSGASLILYRDAAQSVGTFTSLAGGTEPWRAIGRRTTEYGKGTLQELVVYLRDMTAQRQRIEGDMAWYY